VRFSAIAAPQPSAAGLVDSLSPLRQEMDTDPRETMVAPAKPLTDGDGHESAGKGTQPRLRVQPRVVLQPRHLWHQHLR
jgi:hypothetical protein